MERFDEGLSIFGFEDESVTRIREERKCGLRTYLSQCLSFFIRVEGAGFLGDKHVNGEVEQVTILIGAALGRPSWVDGERSDGKERKGKERTTLVMM